MPVMSARPRRYLRFGAALLALALAACAADAGFTKEQLETVLNDELMTGAGPDEIQAFFKRHDFTYSYDADLRRYKGTAAAGATKRLDIYIYTDNDMRLTVAQVLSTETLQKRPATNLPNFIYEGGRPGNRL